MNFALEHVFPTVSCAEYERLYFDEPFNEALSASLNMGRRLLRLERADDRIVRHVQYDPEDELHAAAAEAFGTSRSSFTEELDYDVRARHGAWRTVPHRWSERIRNSGTIEFTIASGGTRCRVRGDVRISLFGLGGIAERKVIAQLEKNFAATMRFTNDYLARSR